MFTSFLAAYINDYKLTDMERNLTFDTDLSFDDTYLDNEIMDDSVDVTESNIPLTTTNIKEQITAVDVNHVTTDSNDLHPFLKSEQVLGEGQSEGQCSDGGFESMHTGVGTQSEARSVIKQPTGSSLEMSDSDHFILQESEVKGQVQTGNQEKSVGNKTDNTQSEQIKDMITNTSLKPDMEENIIGEGSVVQGSHGIFYNICMLL